MPTAQKPTPPPFIRSVSIRNYKSIGAATVELSPFCILIGPNASGKSNFVDTLAFVRDCLIDSPAIAFRNRGGIGAVRRKSAGHPTHIGIRLVVNLRDHTVADYAFEIAAKQGERFSVAKERCIISRFMGEASTFEVREGRFVHEISGIRPKITSDRLALFAAATTEEFSELYEFLVGIRTYSIFPNHIRDIQEADVGDTLKQDGRNAAAVYRRLTELDPSRAELVRSLLAKIAPGIRRIEYQAVGKGETLQFRQEVSPTTTRLFDAHNMSDGTLRVLGLLLAVFQPTEPTLVAIEEPESTVHPAAMELLTQVLLDASHERQIVLTTHSPEVLDYEEIRDDQIRVVTAESNATLIAPLSKVTREALHEHMYTPGELLRVNELNPDRAAAQELAANGSQLFGPPVTKPH